jgi:hypothetical protein
MANPQILVSRAWRRAKPFLKPVEVSRDTGEFDIATMMASTALPSVKLYGFEATKRLKDGTSETTVMFLTAELGGTSDISGLLVGNVRYRPNDVVEANDFTTKLSVVRELP